MAFNWAKLHNALIQHRVPKPPKPVTTSVRVIVRGPRKKGQLALFAAERTLVTRTYDSDGRLIGYKATPIRHYRHLA